MDARLISSTRSPHSRCAHDVDNDDTTGTPKNRKSSAEVSAEAWAMWEERMKMILNEYRLLPFQKEAQALVARQMEEFFFGNSQGLPEGYVPEKQ